MDITAKVTIVCEGTRGPLGQAYRDWQGIKSENPQIFALGVKEIWEVKKAAENVIHTMGWPLPTSAFGGSFFYPMADNLVALGLVVGLDYQQPNLDVHELLQDMKQHPLFARYLEGGECVEWGAKTIPEGGYYSLPERYHGDGVLFCGDTVGFVNVPALKGIHHAMKSGILAADAAFAAVKADDNSAAKLSSYDAAIKESFIQKDLYQTRNMRLAFKSGFISGGIKAGLMTLTKGAFPGGKISVEEDAAEAKNAAPLANGHDKASASRISKVDAVYKSGNKTRDDIPVHLVVGEDISPEMAEFYSHVCPAGVYELEAGKLKVNAPNCVDCKATDVLGPRWTPREGNAGPEYQKM
jgi:electron-transferring-flavoprotein dehydrogenase